MPRVKLKIKQTSDVETAFRKGQSSRPRDIQNKGRWRAENFTGERESLHMRTFDHPVRPPDNYHSYLLVLKEVLQTTKLFY